jgi:lysophospholipase L1-like esterase
MAPAPRSARRRVLALALALLAPLAWWHAPATAAPAGTSQAPPASYAALGDSFTSGPLIPNQDDLLGCSRSDQNYPHLVAPATGLELRDVSCSGAKTNDILGPDGDKPAQLDAVDAGTQLVTVQIGGNDVSFFSVMEDCVVWLPFGQPCQDKFAPGGVDQISARIAATAPKVGQVLDAIHARAPQARILVLGYPAVFPDRGNGCWPSLPLAWADIPWLRAKAYELNTMLSTQATSHGATYVDVYTPSIGRDACASSSARWVEPVVPGSLAAPLHPNLRGMRGMAAAVEARR